MVIFLRDNEVRQTDLNKFKKERNVNRSTFTRVLHFDNAWTAAEITAKIKTLHKHIPQDETLTFQFADGTYSLSTPIYINGFYGGGELIVIGNTADTGSTRSVYLNFINANGLIIENINCTLAISYLKIQTQSANSYNCTQLIGCTNTMLRYLVIVGNAAPSGGSGIMATFSQLSILDSYFSNIYTAIRASRAAVIESGNNTTTGTLPAYGLVSSLAGIIGKTGTQPAGSVANEWISATGGYIF